MVLNKTWKKYIKYFKLHLPLSYNEDVYVPCLLWSFPDCSFFWLGIKFEFQFTNTIRTSVEGRHRVLRGHVAKVTVTQRTVINVFLRFPVFLQLKFLALWCLRVSRVRMVNVFGLLTVMVLTNKHSNGKNNACRVACPWYVGDTTFTVDRMDQFKPRKALACAGYRPSVHPVTWRNHR